MSKEEALDMAEGTALAGMDPGQGGIYSRLADLVNVPHLYRKNNSVPSNTAVTANRYRRVLGGMNGERTVYT